MLRAENISVLRNAVPLLDGVTTVFAPSAVTVVLGENGAGKSTLLDCLCGVRSPDEGQVTFLDEPIGIWSHRERAAQIASIGQIDGRDPGMSVAGRIGQGLVPRRGPDRLLDVAAFAQISAVAETLGVDSLLHRRLSTLSGGERRRVEVARALVDEQARVVILDEPHAGVDVRHQPKVTAALKARAAAGTTIIVSVHHLDVALALGDHFLGLKEGKVVWVSEERKGLDREALLMVFGIHASVRHERGASGILLDDDATSGAF